MKEFVQRQEFEVTVRKEHQIHMELVGMQHITELLHHRNWILLQTNSETGEFITTDNPVSLTWHYPEKVPPFTSPGFGLKETMVYFPLSKTLALVGEFDRKDEVKDANEMLVAILNSKIIANSYQRIFSSKSNFNYIARGSEMKKGKTLLTQA